MAHNLVHVYHIAKSFRQEKIFTISLVVEFLSVNFLSHIIDYIEDMVNSTTWAKLLFLFFNFLHCKDTWTWQSFCIVKNFGCTVYLYPLHTRTYSDTHTY